jgi:predicted RNA-binding protein YlxR (DUF448 family)
VRPQREPERTCVGCRDKAAKRVLLRVARTPEGVRVDPEGKLPGRGVYVHRELACVEAASKRGAFGRALRAGLSAEEAARLRADIEGELAS